MNKRIEMWNESDTVETARNSDAASRSLIYLEFCPETAVAQRLLIQRIWRVTFFRVEQFRHCF